MNLRRPIVIERMVRATLPPTVADKPSLPLKLFLFGYNLDFLYYLLQACFPDISLVPLKLIITVILGFAFFLLLVSGAARHLTSGYQFWFAGLVIYCLAMAPLGWISGNELIPYAIMDVWSLVFLCAILIGADAKNWNSLDKTLFVQYLIGLVIYSTSLFSLDLGMEFDAIRSRYFRNSQTSYLLTTIFAPWIYFLTVKHKSALRRLMAYYGFGLLLFHSLFHEKRIYLAQIGLTLLLLAVLHYRSESSTIRRFWIPLGGMMMRVLLVAFGSAVVNLYLPELPTDLQYLQDATFKRFVTDEVTGKDVGFTQTTFSDYRWSDEPEFVWGELSHWQLLVGKGLGATIRNDYLESGRTAIVHNGIFHLLLKGGVLFAILFCIPVIPLVWNLHKIGFDMVPFHTIIVVSYLLSPFQNILAASPFVTIFLLSLGRCMSKHKPARANVIENHIQRPLHSVQTESLLVQS